MQASATTEDLFKAARAAWRLTLIGSAAPMVQAMRERMMKPRAGDVVIEISTFTTPTFDPDRVGIFVRQEGGEYIIRPYDHQEIEQRWAKRRVRCGPMSRRGLAVVNVSAGLVEFLTGRLDETGQ